MTDPNLNSVHLPAPRREDFRRARQVLLESRGPATQRLEAEDIHGLTGGRSDTMAVPGLRHGPSGPLGNAWFVQLDHEQTFPLKVGVNTVGRLPDNDVVVPDPHVSRRHCAILIHVGQACEVHDTASKNGIYVNGERVTSPTRVKPGDEILMCDHRLVLLNAAEATQSATHCHAG